MKSSFKLNITTQRRSFSTNRKVQVNYTEEQRLLLEKVNKQIQQLPLLKFPIKKEVLMGTDYKLLTSAALIFKQNNFVPDYNLIQSIKTLTKKIFDYDALHISTPSQVIIAELIEDLGKVQESFNLNEKKLDNVSNEDLKSIKLSMVSLINTIVINLEKLKIYNAKISCEINDKWSKKINKSSSGYQIIYAFKIDEYTYLELESYNNNVKNRAFDYKIKSSVPVDFNKVLRINVETKNLDDIEILTSQMDKFTKLKNDILTIKKSNTEFIDELVDHDTFGKKEGNYQAYIDAHFSWGIKFKECLELIEQDINILNGLYDKYMDIHVEFLKNHIKTISNKENSLSL